MLRTIAIILVVLWLLGYFGFRTALAGASGLIHILIVVAIVLFLIDLLGGRRAV
jgi:uncharacterized membrane protein YtjA (UPF0391 family)